MLDLDGQSVIALAPHLDDVELGAGGTLFRLCRTSVVYYVGFSVPPLVEREVFMQEFWNSMKVLGLPGAQVLLHDYDPRDLYRSRSDILQILYDLRVALKPSLILLPNSQDMHQSHEVVYAEGRRAFKFSTLLGYELPWNSMEFSMDVFINLSPEEVDAKVAAVNSYTTQTHRSFFNNNIVRDLARVRGEQIEQAYAECFEAIRIIL